MKQRILSILMLCLAGIMTAAAADYSGLYRIKSPRSSKLVVDNGTTLKVGDKGTATKGNMSEIWQIRSIGNDAYVIVNAGTGRMVQAQPATQKEHSTSATACSPFFIKKNTGYVISSNSDFSGYSCWHEDSSNRIVVWNDTESNSQWTFTKIAESNTDYTDALAAIAEHEAEISKAITNASKMSVLQTGGVFRLKSRYNHYAYEAEDHTVKGAASKKVNDLAQIWIVEKKESCFNIRNAASGRYLPTSGGADAALVTVEGATQYYIKTSDYSSDFFTISWKSDFSGTNCLHENKSSNVVKWNANNAGNSNQYSDWSIEPVDEEDTAASDEQLARHLAEIQGIATTLTTGTYRMVPAAYPTRALSEDGSKNVVTVNATGRYSQVWQLTVSENGKTCTMQNVLTGNFVKNNATTSNVFKTQTGATTGLDFTIGTGGGKYDCFFNFKGSSTGFHCAKSSDYKVVGWAATDPASQWILYPVTVDPEELALEKKEVEEAADLQKNATTHNNTLQKFFEDYACTSLRSEYRTLAPEELRKAMTAENLPSTLQDMAVRVLTNKWEEGKDDKYNEYVRFFRIQDVECYSDNKVWGEITKTGPFGELTSPTGIIGRTGDYVYIFVDEAPKADGNIRALLAYDTQYRNQGELQLKKGLNVWQLPADGEVFINYFCSNSNKFLKDFPKIRVHVEGGTVNGYWDLSREMTNSDWTWLKSNMLKGEFVHVKGLNTVLNLVYNNVKAATKPVEIMKGWDYAFLGLQYLIGHDGQWDGRYNPVVNPRHSYEGNPNWGGYGGSNHTSISNNYLFNYDNFYEGNVWEILHEIGHGCQGPIKMAGTTEVTNNSLANCVTYMMGRNRSRGNGTDKMVQLFNYPDPTEGSTKRGWTWVDYVRYAKPNYDASLHTGNHIWYQLYMYFDVLGNCPGFMGRLFDEMRKDPIVYSGKDKVNGTPSRYDDDFWKVAKAAAKVSQTDLWDFFEAYGFWKYADEIISTSDDDPATTSTAYKNGNRFIGDYGNYSLKLPVRGNDADEKRLADLREYMRSMPNKAGNLMFLDDHIKQGKVREDAFVAEIKPSLVGKALLDYWELPLYPAYGQWEDFDGMDRANGVKFTLGTSNYSETFKTDTNGVTYTITGRKVTMAGTGILGIKIYDANDKLVWLANTKTFVIPAEMANGIKDGTYKFAVAVTPSKEVILAPGDTYTATEDGISSTTIDANGNLDGTYVSGAIFDLNGRRTSSPAGLRIVNGRKVVR